MKISYTTDNNAFEMYPEDEHEYILLRIISKIKDGYDKGNIYDSNGNMIGSWNNKSE